MTASIPQRLRRNLEQVAEKVGSGLGIKQGLLHIEVFVNKQDIDDIIFIESGARPAGGGIPEFVKACGYHDMITLHLLSLFDRRRFYEAVSSQNDEVKEGMQVELLGPEQEGILMAVPSEDFLKANIPGYYSSHLNLQNGKRVGPVTDMFQGPGVINIVGTKNDVQYAEQTIRDLEKQTLYQSRPISFFDKLRGR